MGSEKGTWVVVMRGCHSCETAEQISDGVFADVEWKEMPCSQCNVMCGMDIAVEFNDDHPLEEEGVTGNHDHRQHMLPVAVMREAVVGLLSLPPEVRDVVAWRFAGMTYEDIGELQGESFGCVEKRHKRALNKWPALRAMFPEKVAKQKRRKKHVSIAH
jgi:hypothetical protein